MSYKHLMEYYVGHKARIVELDAEVADLKAKLDTQEKALAEREGETDEGITPARMKKVLNQRPEADSGPLEERIREWLSKGVGAFEAAIREKEERAAGVDEMRAENARLKARLAAVDGSTAGPDQGTAAAFGVIEKLLADFKAGDR